MKKLNDYIDEIMEKEHALEELKAIDSEVRVLYKAATPSELKAFDESGAGDMLGMLLEYLDE